MVLGCSDKIWNTLSTEVLESVKILFPDPE